MDALFELIPNLSNPSTSLVRGIPSPSTHVRTLHPSLLHKLPPKRRGNTAKFPFSKWPCERVEGPSPTNHPHRRCIGFELTRLELTRRSTKASRRRRRRAHLHVFFRTRIAGAMYNGACRKEAEDVLHETCFRTVGVGGERSD